MSSHASSALTVCLDARFPTAWVGGVEQTVIGLAAGLCSLTDGGEQYRFLTLKGHDEWLRPYLAAPCDRLFSLGSPPRLSRIDRLKRSAPVLRKVITAVPVQRFMHRPGPPHSDGVVESAGVELMHFTAQHAFLTEVATIYSPQDLQHIHFPHFFTPRERDFRDRSYRLHSERASAVVVMSRWGADDLVSNLGIDRRKVWVIPPAPVLPLYSSPSPERISAVMTKFGVDEGFALYPAALWPHKNHAALFEALAILKQRYGLRIPLICCGLKTPRAGELASRARQLGLIDQVRIVGFVSTLELMALYSAARCLVFPSLFEGWGMPVTEAFWAGVPVAAAHASTLPDVVADAGLLFNPLDPEDMAENISRVWRDDAIRNDLIARGRERVAPYTWERSAAAYRALYRRIAGRDLSVDDERRLVETAA